MTPALCASFRLPSVAQKCRETNSHNHVALADAPALLTIAAAALTIFEVPQDRALAIRFNNLGAARVLSLAEGSAPFNVLGQSPRTLPGERSVAAGIRGRGESLHGRGSGQG